MASQADIEAKFAQLFPGPSAANWADDDEDDEEVLLDYVEVQEDLYDDDSFLLVEEADDVVERPPPPPSLAVDDRLTDRDIHSPAGYWHPLGVGASVFDGWGGCGLQTIPEDMEEEDGEGK